MNVKQVNSEVETMPIMGLNGLSKINVLNARELEPKLKEFVNTCEHSCTIDLHGIRFIDSVGFSMILNLVKQGKLNQKNVLFSNVHPEVSELIQMLGISDSMLSIEDYI